MAEYNEIIKQIKTDYPELKRISDIKLMRRLKEVYPKQFGTVKLPFFEEKFVSGETAKKGLGLLAKEPLIGAHLKLLKAGGVNIPSPSAEQLETGQRIGIQAGGSALNQALLGIPGGVARQAGTQLLPTPETKMEELAATAGSLTGAIVPYMVGAGITKAIMPSAGWLLSGSATAGVAEAIRTGDDEKLTDWNERLLRTAIGTGAGAVIGTAGRVAQAGKNIYKSAIFMDKIDDAFLAARRAMTQEFGESLKTAVSLNPKAKVNIAQAMFDSIDDIQNSPRLQRILKKVPEFKNIKDFTDPRSYYVDMNAIDAQNLINNLQSEISPSKLLGGRAKMLKGGRINIEDKSVLHMIESIKEQQLAAYPEVMGSARAIYAQKVKGWKDIKYLINPKNLEPAVKQKFYTSQQKRIVEKLLPSSLIKEMGGFSNAYKGLYYAWRVSLVGGGYWAFRKLLKATPFDNGDSGGGGSQ